MTCPSCHWCEEFKKVLSAKIETTMISRLRYHCGHVLKPQLNLMRYSLNSLFGLIGYLYDISIEIFKRILHGYTV